MKHLITTLIFLLLVAGMAVSASFEGRVVDPSGKPLEAVSVVTDIAGVGTQSDREGRFILKGSDEITRFTFSAVGYRSRQFRVEQLPDEIVLDPMYIEGEDILVTADRVRAGASAVTHVNMSCEDIERNYTVGEFPLLLGSTPNLYSWSDGGSALGYSYMSIRGFNDTRVSTYINGVPLNDPEDQATYFVDLPDFAANVTDIQVQRGVGNSLYGDASFGGSINIVTQAFARPRSSSLTLGYGEYTSGGSSVSDIYKQSAEFSSGLVDGRWVYGGRFSKQKSGGYRHNSWYEGWSYYMSVARLDHNMWTELHIYGGPMKMHLSYSGETRAQLEQDWLANTTHAYSNETDNFNQPHYQLHNVYQLSDNATLSNTLYYIRGKGYYEQYKGGRDYFEYNIPASVANGVTEGDLVRQKWVRKNQYGWNPRLDIKHDKGVRSIGGSFYYFNSEHWGQVVWAQGLTGGLDTGFDPQNRYYEYFGKKYQASLYVQESRDLTDKFNLELTTQGRYQKYNFDQTRMGAFKGHKYDLDWLFFSPRIGLTYNVDERLSLYSFFAVSSRTPTDAAIYDGDEPFELPLLEIESTTIVGTDTTYKFGDPTLKNERVYDLELGAQYRSEHVTFSANLFWMEFKNENIRWGGIDEGSGNYVTVNADRSYHAGIELAAAFKPIDLITIDGNFAYNHNRIREYSSNIEVYGSDWSWVGYQTVDFKDKTINGFPEYLGNLSVTQGDDNKWMALKARFVGKQYIELWNIEELAIDPYMSASWTGSYTFENLMGLGNATFLIGIENLFDKKHESAGYSNWNYAMTDGGSSELNHKADDRYFVAAERWFWTQVKLDFF